MFIEARTRPLLVEVCRSLGLSGADATLLRHHTNAVYALDDAVVKIAPPGVSGDHLRPMVLVIRWLVEQGFPTVDLYPGITQPFDVDGHAVTVWRRLDPADDHPVTVAELGMLLRHLHELPAPPSELRRLEPIAEIHRSILASAILTDDDRQLLHTHLNQLAKIWAAAQFPLSPGLIHTDPQTRNALRRVDGSPVLADWDAASIGPREWDLATIAVHSRRFSPSDLHAFEGFATTYGWDPRTWDGFEKLCRLRELKMITTNARKSGPDTPAAHEVHQRIAALRDGDRAGFQWQLI